MIEKGKVICFEGGDKAGKYTQAMALKNWLISKDICCEYVSYPRYENPEAGPIINMLKGDFGALENFDPYLMTTLYAHDRAKDKPRIDKLLADGVWIIFDRYVYSNMAYQCSRSKAHMNSHLLDFIYNLEFYVHELNKPDIVFYIKTDDALRKARIEKDGADDDFEKSDSLQSRVSRMYDVIAEKYNFKIIESGNLNKEEIGAQIIEHINGVFKVA